MFANIPQFVLGATLNLVVAIIIVRFVYYPVTQSKNFVFTFLSFNTIVYFVLGFLTSIELSIGVGFGLFAIFSVLRYRTDEIPAREMTYLFIIIALPVMNSVMSSSEDFIKLLIANGTIMTLLYIVEKEWGFHFEISQRITYELVDHITPEKRDLLLANLRQRTGLPIKRVEIGRIDFLRDTVELRAFYDNPRDGYHTGWTDQDVTFLMEREGQNERR
jgi:hypothetical protein